MKKAGVAAKCRWRILSETPAQRDRLARRLAVHPILAQLMVNRELEQSAEARDFLEPSLHQLPDPQALPGFEAALECLSEAREAEIPILIHGDYDVDGLCGTALLYRLFRQLGQPVSVYLPDRFRDGYSFGPNSLAAIREREARLVIAVDNGTTALAEVAELEASGVRVLVVDHHQPGDQLPNCSALLNPWVAPPEERLFPWFCGTGVAYLLAWGFLRHLHGEKRLPERDRKFLIDHLGLAALATVADVMPLRGPNRALTAKGLQSLSGSGLPGLRALAAAAGVRGAPTAEDLGFRLAPRLNAAGRLGRTELAFELLTTASERRAEELAATLESLNLERREIERREMERWLPEAEAHRERGEKVLFLGEPESHFGVLGIVANRLMEATGLPTLLWAECGPGVARGSGRAPAGVDLVDILANGADHMQGFGGHARAAGFHFDPANADDLARALRAGAAGLGDGQPESLEIDAEVAPRDLDTVTVRELQRLAPFGEGNREPIFLACGLRLAAAPKRIGDGSHATLTLERHGASVRALGWRMAERLAELEAGDAVDVVFSPSINTFAGRTKVEWTIQDLRTAKPEWE